MGGSECYRERVESELAPCLAHFAAAAGKDLLWKPLNHKLLLQSRHSDSQVHILHGGSMHALTLNIGY